MIDVSKLTTTVAANTSVVGSAVTLIQGFRASQEALSKQLAEALASSDPAAMAAVQKSIDDSVTALASSESDLAAAVAQNTPDTTA